MYKQLVSIVVNKNGDILTLSQVTVGAQQTNVLEVTYGEKFSDKEFFSCNSEYFRLDDWQLALEAFDNRANAKDHGFNASNVIHIDPMQE